MAAADEELIRRVADGDEQALRELFATYGPYAKALALRIVASAALAEEVVQEVFLSVWQHAAESSSADAVVAYIRPGTREVRVMVGEREVVHRDADLARRILRAAK